MKHIVSFSGGMGSFAEAKSCVDKYGKENVLLVFSDTKMEDEDLYRFLNECVEFLGCELVTLCEGRTPWELFKDDRFIANTRVDTCSSKLKRQLLISWIYDNYGYIVEEPLHRNNGDILTDIHGVVLTKQVKKLNAEVHLGIDFSEHHRLTEVQKRMSPWIYRSTLVEEGRIVPKDYSEQFGIPRPRLYTMGFGHNNCFAGETKVPTLDGIFSLKELEGKEATVLTSDGFNKGTVFNFGKQNLVKLVLSRNGQTREVLTTANHRWYKEDPHRKYRKVVETLDLKVGDVLATFDSDKDYSSFILDKDSVARGIVYGDGTREKHSNGSSRIVLCGLKAKLAVWFDNEAIPHTEGLYIGKLPRTWKDKPEVSEVDWPSWLAGYFAADGSYTAKSCTLSTANKENIDLIRYAAFKAGVPITGVCAYEREGFGKVSWVYEVGLRMPKELILREEHLVFAKSKTTNIRRWKVKALEVTNRVEDVFCFKVPSTENFSLLDGLATLNCGGFCVKAGLGQFKLLHEKMPERYKYHEQQEQETILLGGLPFLRKTKNKKRRYISLKEYREEYLETGKAEEDKFDIGGCACALPIGIDE